jgi:hypothetical protein
MADTNIKVSLELVDKATQKVLNDFIKKSDSADQSLKKVGETGKSTFHEIGIAIGKSTGIFDIFAGNLAANLATKALDLLENSASALFQTFIVDGVKAAQEQEKASNDLNVALALTGIYSERTAQEFDKLADTIQATTGVSDDAVITNAALIQSLGQLDKEGLKRATVAAVDLSAALGKDLGTTSEALGKAAAGNTTAIQKMGISFQKGANDTITFNNILKALEDRFGGAAAAKVNTFAGSIDLTKAAFGELQEEIGNVIVENAVVIEAMKAAGNVISDLTGGVEGNKDAFKQMVGQGLIIAIEGMIGFAAVTDSVVRIVTASIRGVETVFQGLASASLKILSLFSDDAKEVADGMFEAFKETAESAGQAFSEDTNLSKATEILARLREGALKGMDALKTGADSANPALAGLKGKTDELTDSQKLANDELQKWALNLAQSNLDGQASLDARIEAYRLHKEQLILTDSEFNTISFDAEMAFLTQKQEAQNLFYDAQIAKVNEARAKDLIDETKQQAAIKAIQEKAAADFKKIEIEKTKFVAQNEQSKQDTLKQSLNTISTLQNSKNRELFYIGKAAAIANATISTYEGIAKAWSYGPILGPPLAALVGVAGFANIANIASQQPAFESGGIVGGNSFTGDRIGARVNSGEMILNRNQQMELFKMANGAGGSGDSISRTEFYEAINQIASRPVVVEIDGREIVKTVRSELNAGRTFA